MKIATIDNIYDATFKNNTVTVKDQNGQMIGSKPYILNYRPIVGFDILDQIAMEQLACDIVDEFKMEKK